MKMNGWIMDVFPIPDVIDPASCSFLHPQRPQPMETGKSPA
jgi:hypothetical protein